MAAPKSRPALRGLFSSKSKSDISVTLTSMSTYDYGSKSTSPSKTSPDKKESPFAKGFTHFSNYKPKILAGSGDGINGGFGVDSTPEKQSVSAMDNNHRGNLSARAVEMTKASIHPEPAIPSTSSASAGNDMDLLFRKEKSELGNYTPSYLTHKSSSEQKSREKQTPSAHTKPTSGGAHKVSVKKGRNTKSSSNVIIMGDKDTPIMLDDPSLDTSLDDDELPDELPQDSFTEAMEDTSASLDTILTLGEEPPRSRRFTDSGINGNNHLHRLKSESKETRSSLVNGDDGDPTMPYIPPPDYDEDEMMIEISDDEDPSTIRNPKNHQMRGTKVYKVFQGEDFGKYLVDDESAFASPLLRTQIRYDKGNRPKSAKGSKTDKKRNKDKTNRGGNGKKKHDQGEETLKRRTIHDISFTGTKLGIGDSSKNRASHGWQQSRKDLGSPTSKSRYSDYELFLRDRKKGQLKNGSVENTSDSGNESGEGSSKDSYPNKGEDPQTLPNRYAKKNNSIWEKLTWRFRSRNRGEIMVGDSR